MTLVTAIAFGLLAASRTAARPPGRPPPRPTPTRAPTPIPHAWPRARLSERPGRDRADDVHSARAPRRDPLRVPLRLGLAALAAGRRAAPADARELAGWTVSIPSPPRRSFSGDSVLLTQALDIVAVEKTISSYLLRTGIATDNFTLTATPHVSVRGTVSGRPVDTTFDPTPLTFIVDGSALRLAASGSTGGLPGQPAADPLHPRTAGTIAVAVPQTLGLAGRSLPVAKARRLALRGLASRPALGLLALLADDAGRRGDPDRRR